MSVKKTFLVLIAFTFSFLYAEDFPRMEYDKHLETQMIVETKNGFVATKELAIQLAEVYLINIYGEHIKKRFPLKAILKDEIWYITGTLSEGYEGGVPIIKISKKTGAVLGFVNSK